MNYNTIIVRLDSIKMPEKIIVAFTTCYKAGEMQITLTGFVNFFRGISGGSAFT